MRQFYDYGCRGRGRRGWWGGVDETRSLRVATGLQRPDGTQGEGVSFSMEDKVRLATRLDALGIHYIEGGWPGSNPKDLRFFRRMQDVALKHAKLAAFSMTRRAGGNADSDANMQALLESG